jgi:uncharacterized membrane protein YdjX (TVP38/TMEM64 family)
MDASARSEPDAGPDAPRGRRPEIAFGLGGFALGGALVAGIPDLRRAFSLALHGNLDGLHAQFHALGLAGVALLLGLILAHAVVFYPTEIVTATAGFLYGFVPGLALVTAGWLGSAVLAYLLGRALGRPFVHAVFGGRRFSTLERVVERGGISLLVTVRMIPLVPFSLIGYIAGAVRIPLWRFAWTTVLGYLPQCALLVYFGSQAQSLSIGDPRVWIGLAVIVALLGAARLIRFERVPLDGD